MKKLDFKLVLKKMPLSLLYFAFGYLLGFLVTPILFFLNRSFLEFILNVWSRRILFGINFFPRGYWFILNNLFVLALAIVSVLLIAMYVTKTPDYRLTKKFKVSKKKRTKIVLFGLYLIPAGSLTLNSFLISLFLTYISLNFGILKFLELARLLLNYAFFELLALFLATSLGFAYLEILSPFILKESWKKCKEIGKRLLFSRTTALTLSLVFALVVIAGILEGSFI